MVDNASFRNYVIEKQAIAEVLINLKKLVGSTRYSDPIQELLVKLAQDRFNLVVVGQFKRGKSSLMNAIIGRDLLPTGYLPLTSAITSLCYGPKDRAMLKFKGWMLEDEIPLTELREYITEEGNPGNVKGLLYAQIEIPSAFLRRGLYFIDTPGIGSSRHENTQTTYDFLPEADALIFVTSVEGPLTETEEQFLRDIQKYQRKLFVVVNKIDLLGVDELDEVIHYIRREIVKVSGASFLRLFPLSAKQGIQAKLIKDEVMLASSGLKEFEVALEQFLAEQKEQSFLLSILDHSLQIVQSLDGEFRSSSNIDSLHQAKQILHSFHSSLSGEVPMETVLFHLVNQPLPEQVIKDLPKLADKGSAKSSDPLSSSTCPICFVQSKAIFYFFADWQYEFTSAGDVKESFLARRGFCHFHTWQFQKITSPQEISTGYVPLIEILLKEMQNTLCTEEYPLESIIENPFCPACQFLKEIEGQQAQIIADLLQTSEGLARYSDSNGLCLPHMFLVIQKIHESNINHAILEVQIHRFEELLEDLRSFTLKRTAIQRGLLNSEEKSAWFRALTKIVGDQMAYYHH